MTHCLQLESKARLVDITSPGNSTEPLKGHFQMSRVCIQQIFLTPASAPTKIRPRTCRGEKLTVSHPHKYQVRRQFSKNCFSPPEVRRRFSMSIILCGYSRDGVLRATGYSQDISADVHSEDVHSQDVHFEA